MLGGAGVTSLSWAEYPILRFSEMPEIDVDLLGAPDEPPLGMGEARWGRPRRRSAMQSRMRSARGCGRCR